MNSGTSTVTGEDSETCAQASFSTYKTVRVELFFEGKLQDTLYVFNWLHFACRRNLQRCVLVFNFLNILIPIYLAQFFFLQGIGLFMIMRLEEKNDLHPPQLKQNLGKRTFKYAGKHYPLV